MSEKYLVITEDMEGIHLLNKINQRISSLLEYQKTFESHRIGLDPLGNPSQVASKIIEFLNSIGSKANCDCVLLLLDFEKQAKQQGICTGDRSQEIIAAFNKKRKLLRPNITCFEEVIKNRCLENWLVSDIEVFNKFLTKEPKKALPDILNIDEVSVSTFFNKKALRNASPDPLRMAQNSRSFRRYLRVIGHPDYAEQSKLPATQS